MHRSAPVAPVLIAPECHAPGCHQGGDQYTMVKCRSCGHWYCGEHFAADDAPRAVSLVGAGLHGLAYYQGRCAACRKQPVRRPVDSSWLR